MNVQTVAISPAGARDYKSTLAADWMVPAWPELLAAVRDGEVQFTRSLEAAGLSDSFGVSTSIVHDYREIELHAVILGIVSVPRWSEVRCKSYLTYASHWIDDFFDNPGKVPCPERLLANRYDVSHALASIDRPGAVGFAMARRARHPRAVFKALHRMFYGGLVQRSTDRSERARLMSEYRQVATRFVLADLADAIRDLNPSAYWTTNKTVLELLAAAEVQVDYTRCEAWNLLYAPAIYCQDAEEERARGELSFDDDAPAIDDLLEMIRLGDRFLGACDGYSRLSVCQLDFVTRSLPNLPSEIAAEYHKILARQRSHASDQFDPGLYPHIAGE